MRKAVLLGLIANTIAACSPRALTEDQAAIAAELEAAPPRSIVILNDIPASSWGIVCGRDDNDRLGIAKVSYAGITNCHSYVHDENDMWARRVDAVITPDNPEYSGKIEELMLGMLIRDE